MSLTRRDDGSYISPDDPGEIAYSSTAPRASVTDEEGAILARLATGLRVLEIGTGLGVSTRYLASTADIVFTIDTDPWVQSSVWPDLAVLSNVVCASAIDAWGEFDLVFVDGNHATDSVKADIDRVLPLCKAGGKIVFHDANYPHVREAIDSRFFRCEHIPTTHGIAIVKVSA